jgi:uncharacterized HAD superfamily protein
MTSKKTFVFDVDDTVADLLPVIASYLKKNIPNFNVLNIQHRETFKYLNITLQDWIDIMNHEKMLHPENLKPKAGVELVTHLERQGHRVEFLTARAFYHDAHGVTEQWLKTHTGIVSPKVHVVGMHESKADYMLKNDLVADMFFDDVPFYCTDVLNKKAAKEAICIHMPWIHQASAEERSLFRLVKSLKDVYGEFGLEDESAFTIR